MAEHEPRQSPRDAVEELAGITESSELSHADGTVTKYTYFDNGNYLPNEDISSHRIREDILSDGMKMRRIDMFGDFSPSLSVERADQIDQATWSESKFNFRENPDNYRVKIVTHSSVLPVTVFTAHYPESGSISDFRIEVSRVLRDQDNEFIAQVSERMKSLDPQTYRARDFYPPTPELIANSVSIFQASPEVLTHVIDRQMKKDTEEELSQKFTETQEVLIHVCSNNILGSSLVHIPEALSFSDEQRDQFIKLMQKPFEKRLKEELKPQQLAILEDKNALLQMLIVDSEGKSGNSEFEKLLSAIGLALDTTFWSIDRSINTYLNQLTRSHFEFTKKDEDTYGTVIVSDKGTQTKEDLRVGNDIQEGIYNYSLNRNADSLSLRVSNRINRDESHVIVFPESLGDTKELNSLFRTSDHIKWAEIFDRLAFGYSHESF